MKGGGLRHATSEGGRFLNNFWLQITMTSLCPRLSQKVVQYLQSDQAGLLKYFRVIPDVGKRGLPGVVIVMAESGVDANDDRWPGP